MAVCGEVLSLIGTVGSGHWGGDYVDGYLTMGSLWGGCGYRTPVNEWTSASTGDICMYGSRLTSTVAKLQHELHGIANEEATDLVGSLWF